MHRRSAEQPADGRHVIVRRPGEEPLVDLVSGHRFARLADGAETGGAFALQEWVPPPGLPWVRPHRHRADDEGFYVLEGTLLFEVDGRRFAAPAGTWVLVPRGVVHTWRNPGGAPARFLTLLSPARFEAWFRSARDRAANEEYGIEFVGDTPTD